MKNNDTLTINEPLLRKIVWAIVKANGEDMRDYLTNNNHETNNALMLLKGDFINDNLRNLIVSDEIEMIPFKRYGWSGRILADKVNKITYTITTQQTLKAIPKKKGRLIPHYLQSILFSENGEYEAPIKQMTFSDYGYFGITEFESKELEDDYKKIMGGYISSDDGYHHYIVAYEAEHGEVKSIDLLLLDKEFDIVAEISLNDYIKLDFGRLTEPNYAAETATKEENVHSLVNVKQGVKPKLREAEKQG